MASHATRQPQRLLPILAVEMTDNGSTLLIQTDLSPDLQRYHYSARIGRRITVTPAHDTPCQLEIRVRGSVGRRGRQQLVQLIGNPKVVDLLLTDKGQLKPLNAWDSEIPLSPVTAEHLQLAAARLLEQVR